MNSLGTMFYRLTRVTIMFMNIKDIKSRWNEVKGNLKHRYDILTDDDLTLCIGRESLLMGRLQDKLGMTKADILKIIGEA